MASNPAFAVTPKVGMAQVSVANSNRDGTTGTYVTVITGASTGTRIAEVTIEPTVTTTAGMVRLFLFDGTNTRLWDEITVSAVVPSATVKAARVVTLYNNLLLPNASWQLKASTENANAINVFAMGADL